jgi:hypothetical protein
MQGYDIAKRATMEFLDSFAETVDTEDREVLRCVARWVASSGAAAVPQHALRLVLTMQDIAAAEQDADIGTNVSYFPALEGMRKDPGWWQVKKQLELLLCCDARDSTRHLAMSWGAQDLAADQAVRGACGPAHRHCGGCGAHHPQARRADRPVHGARVRLACFGASLPGSAD